MAQKWYPVIDYAGCIECGTCSSNCPHGVYDMSKVPSPVVTNTMGCVDHCHHCGDNCPAGAITYVGEDTGWTPPALKKGPPVDTSPSSGCCCGQC